jgi:hypothetical protein
MKASKAKRTRPSLYRSQHGASHSSDGMEEGSRLPSTTFVPRPCVPVYCVMVPRIVKHTGASAHTHYRTKVDGRNRPHLFFHQQPVKDAKKYQGLKSLE